MLLYDTCESGSVARSASTEKSAAMDRLTQAVGINVIAASDADQPARIRLRAAPARQDPVELPARSRGRGRRARRGDRPRPNRITVRAVAVELTKGGQDDGQLKAYTLVRLIRLEGDRALIARDARELGYVPVDALAEIN